MKTILVKSLLIIPVILFLDWVIMIIIGSLSNIFGATDKYFCSVYCNFGITLLIATLIIAAFLIARQNLQHKVDS